MKTYTNSLILLALMSLGIQAAERTDVAFIASVGQINLEGPAVTGSDDSGGTDKDGYGFRIDVETALSERWYVKGLIDWASWDDRFYIIQSTLGVGRIFPLHQGEQWSTSLYLLPALEYIQLEGIDAYVDEPEFGGRGTGEDGNDVGLSLESGITLTHARGLSGTLYAKYLNFDEADGPAFGLRFALPLNASWRALASWEGIWVEDQEDFPIDLATQRITVGISRRF